MSLILQQIRNGLLLLFGLYGLPAFLEREAEKAEIAMYGASAAEQGAQQAAMNSYMLWMAIGTVVIFALYGLRCLLAGRDKPVRKWAFLTAAIALVLTVRLTLEFARVGYVVLNEGVLDFEAEEFDLAYILEDLFTFDLTGLSFFCGAAGVCLSVLLANLLTRRKAAAAGLDAFAPFGALMVVLFRVGQTAVPLSGRGKELLEESAFSRFPFAMAVVNERGITTWVWAICMLSAAFALAWAVVSFVISFRGRGRTGLNLTMTLFFLCVPQILCESMRENDIRWLFVHAEELFCAVTALAVMLVWVIGSRGIPFLKRFGPLMIMAACIGLLVVTEFAIDGKWFDFSRNVCYCFMIFVLILMGFAGAWAARNWNRSAKEPAAVRE